MGLILNARSSQFLESIAYGKAGATAKDQDARSRSVLWHDLFLFQGPLQS